MSKIKVNSLEGVGASTPAISIDNASGTCTANITNNLSNRNLIINGAFQVAQRGTSSTTDGYSTVDRWQGKMGNVSVTPTQSQQSTSTSDTPYQNGFANFFRIALPSAGTANSNGQIEMRHLIESQNILNSGWNYKSSSAFLTLSFWFRCSTNQTFYIYFYNPDSGKVLVLDFTASANNTWTKITKQLKGDSTLVFNNDNGAGLQVSLFAFHGTAYTNNRSLNTWGGYDGTNFSPDMATTWLTAGASTFDITGVQLEVDHTGSGVATDFEHRSFADELLRCQRYYQIGPSESAPGVLAGRGAGTSAVFATIPLICTMRAVPSLSDSVVDGVYAYTYNSRPQASSGSVTTNSSNYNAHGGYLNLLISGFGGNIVDDRICNIGGFATGDKIILNAEL